MKSTLQDIQSIAPMSEEKKDRDDDLVRASYEEGKRFLESRNYAQAAVSLHNALLGYEERGDEAGVANASNQLGHVCLARQEFAAAHLARLDFTGIHQRRGVQAVDGVFHSSVSLSGLPLAVRHGRSARSRR